MNIDQDYVDSPVPTEARRSPFHVLSVWVGFIIVVGIMAVGGGLVPQMQRDELIAAIVVGNFILGLFAALSGYIGASSGYSFSQLVGCTFTNWSWKAVSLYPTIALVGWYAIECAIFGNLLGAALDLSWEATRVAMALSAIGFGITTYIGFRAIKWASAVLVPAIIILGVYAVYEILGLGGSETFATSEAQLTFAQGLGPVIGSWALGVVAAYPDLARFCRSPMVAALIGFFGILVFNSLTLLLGVAGAAYTGEYDPALILVGLGAIPLAILLGVANLWTTNDNNLYSASLGLARVTKWSRQKAVVVSAALGLVIALFDPTQFSFFFGFLAFLGNTAPALGGVVFGGYLALKRSKVHRARPQAAWGDGSSEASVASSLRD